MIRGFAANRLLLSVDGVRMNNAFFRGGNLQNSIAVDPFSIKNTEVIFGSGSVIYWAAASDTPRDAARRIREAGRALRLNAQEIANDTGIEEN